MSATLPKRLELPIAGMTCASCATRIEKRLNKLEGVEATVNYATENAAVHFDPLRVAPEDLIAAIEAAGYQARLAADDPVEADEDPTAPLRRRLIVSALLSLPVLLLAMIEPLQFDNWQWLSLQLATPVVLWGAWPFHRAAWANLKHATATMDTLISVGTLAAWGWSMYALFIGDAGVPGMRMDFQLLPANAAGGDEIYLEIAGIVTTFLLAGRYFEARAKRRAGAALTALLELGAKDAHVLDDRGVERRVAPRTRSPSATGSSSVQARRSRPMASWRKAHSAIDRSLLTGESMPVEVAPGDAVIGATVNVGGRLVVRATRVGADTALAQIARLVTEAQSGKAAGAAARGPRLGGVRADRDRHRRRDTRLLGRRRRGRSLRVRGGSRGPDHRLPLCARARHANRSAGGDRPWRATRHPDQGARGARVHAPGRHDPARQDGHSHHGEDERWRSRGARRRRRPSDALRLVGALEHASEHPIARAIARAAAGALGALPPVDAFTNREGLGVEGVVDGHAVLAGRPSLLADWALDLAAGAGSGPRGSSRGRGPDGDRGRLGRRAAGGVRGRRHGEADAPGGGRHD